MARRRHRRPMAEGLLRAGLLRPGQVVHLVVAHDDGCRAPDGQGCTCGPMVTKVPVARAAPICNGPAHCDARGQKQARRGLSLLPVRWRGG